MIPISDKNCTVWLKLYPGLWLDLWRGNCLNFPLSQLQLKGTLSSYHHPPSNDQRYTALPWIEPLTSTKPKLKD